MCDPARKRTHPDSRSQYLAILVESILCRADGMEKEAIVQIRGASFDVHKPWVVPSGDRTCLGLAPFINVYEVREGSSWKCTLNDLLL